MKLVLMSKGAALGAVNTLITYPIETLKVHNQIGIAKDFNYNITALYHGSSVPLMAGSIISSSIFTVRGITEKIGGAFFSGAAGGAVGSIFVHYLDTLRVMRHISMIKTHSYDKKRIKIDPEMYFSTFHWTLLKETVQGGMFFYLISENQWNHDMPQFIIGLLAGLITSVVIYPIDTIKTAEISKRKKIGILQLYDGYFWYGFKSIVSAVVVNFGTKFLDL